MTLNVILVVLFITGVCYGLPFSHSECQHDGITYREGQEIRLADPCVKCSCNKGSMVCRLRVCAAQPLPPPRGCWLLTRQDECCQKLVCAEETDMGSARSGAEVRFTDEDVRDGCLVNGTVYAEGSAMDSSTRCQYCYCIKGHQHCVTPHCLLTEPGCTPNYNTQDCCPTKYNCSDITADPSTTTTSLPPAGCTVEEKFYPEGEMVTSSPSKCENCYCLKGQIRCEPVICSLPVDAGCTPILTPGHCCPTSYNCNPSKGVTESDVIPVDPNEETWMLEVECEKHGENVYANVNFYLQISNNEKFSYQHVYSERSMTDTLVLNSENKSIMATTEPTKTIKNSTTTQPTMTTTYTTDTATTIPTTLTDITTTTYFETTMDLTTESYTSTIITTEIPTTTDETTITTMSNSVYNDTEERIASIMDAELTTTLRTDAETTQTETTIIPTTVDPEHDSDVENKANNISDTDKSLSSELEAILNNTQDKNDDYEDYDYPTLPPSLPNLRIIPFVAADAVVDKPENSGYTAAQEKSHATDSPLFYEALHSNRFSPPAETEGGFLPREPLIDGPFYESKYDAPYHTTGINGIAVDITSETKLPSITEQPKIHDDERCSHGGQSYRHGELLTEPNACDLCLCYYGEILCQEQEPKCPPVKSGCHRLLEKEHGSCCGKIICGSNQESPTRVVDHITPLPSGLQHAVPQLPTFTVANDVVTPDPFRDVIRTEPAPDLPALIGEIMPYLWDHSSTTIPHPFSNVHLTTPISITTETISETSEIPTTTAPLSTASNQIESNHTVVPTENNTKIANNAATITNKSTTWNPFSWEEEETTKNPDYEDTDSQNGDDSFSLHSIFNYLLNNEPLVTSSTSVRPNVKAKKPVRTNTTLLDIKVMNKTFSPNTINIKNGSEEILENRSDDNTNLILTFAGSSSEQPSLSTSHGYGYPDDTKFVNVSDLDKSTTKSTSVSKLTSINTLDVSHTTMKYISSTRKHITKYSSFTGPRRPLLSKPIQHQNLPSLSVPDPGAASGLLKLAGCNIYGRMYRVGRIISELSGPCLECMCTEVGVQCRPLKC